MRYINDVFVYLNVKLGREFKANFAAIAPLVRGMWTRNLAYAPHSWRTLSSGKKELHLSIRVTRIWVFLIFVTLASGDQRQFILGEVNGRQN